MADKERFTEQIRFMTEMLRQVETCSRFYSLSWPAGEGGGRARLASTLCALPLLGKPVDTDHRAFMDAVADLGAILVKGLHLQQ